MDMPMMNMQAWSLAQLQTIRSFVGQAQREGMRDVAALLAVLDAKVEEVYLQHARQEKRTVPVSAGPSVCPACGQMAWAPVHNTEGLRVFGCKKCRYSRIGGGN